ncbi:MAG: T3SS (YopN, CesT) and YbjN peptide-binding chaperone 1 [Pseudanabaenaceae cyanobacterium]
MSISSLQMVCYDRLLHILKGEYIDLHTPNAELPIPVVILTQGSAAVALEVRPWRESIMIAIWTYVVTGANITADLCRFLLRQNELLKFGGFSLDSDNDIRLQANLYGSNFSSREVLTVVQEILSAADHYDDLIVQTWGGKRAIDHLSHR